MLTTNETQSRRSLLGSNPSQRATDARGLIITTKQVQPVPQEADVSASESGAKAPSAKSEKPRKLPISLTQAAIDAAKAALTKRQTPDAAIRLGIRGGGCSGFSYVIEFDDDEPGSRDRVYDFDGVKIYVDKKSLIYLNGSVLDFEKTLMRQGFKFRNPNEASSCSCGTSFTVK